ncbi:MAG: beta-keto acid cleavage family enzyme [Bacillota bacterium]
MANKIIITAAISGGIHVPSQSPYLPITPDEIADEVLRAQEAGAAAVHIHARNPENGEPSSDINLYREIVEKIKAHCNIVICITTGGALGMPLDKRIGTIPELKPELASFNMGSINFALYPVLNKITEFKYPWEQEYLKMTEDYAFANTFKALKYFSKVMTENQTKQELEIYDIGQLNNVAQLIREGYLKTPLYLQFVMGILGGIPATVNNLVFLVTTAKELIGDFVWSVCAAGKHQLPMAAAALAMGGNVRVGLEDSLYAAKGTLAKSNAEQVEIVAKIANYLSLEIADADEARKILGLKGLEKVNF